MKGDVALLTKEERDKAKRELWFYYFTQYLFKKNMLSEDEKLKIEKRIV